MKVLYIVSFLPLLNVCGSARILAVIPVPSFSHQVVFHPLWKELSLRGHHVTVLTTNPINDPLLTNLTEIDLSFSYKFLEEELGKIITSSQNPIKSLRASMDAFINVVDAQLRSPEVQKLIQDPFEHFDLLIVEYFLAAPVYFARKFKCPHIGILSVDAPNTIQKAIGGVGHPILYPHQFAQLYGPTNLFQRVYLVGLELLYTFGVHYFESQENVGKKYFEDDTPVRAIFQNASLLFVNSDPIFSYVRPLLPSIIPIGGNVARLPVKPLEQNVKRYLDEARQGFIYFSLGSNVKGKDIPADTMNVILATFLEIPYKILWKYELSDLPSKPDNVMISKWVSQMEVLRHPNLKLFITHGGAQSMEETISARVPVVGMPFFADQPFNVKKMVSMGFALSVDYRSMSKEQFRAAILEVINNQRYRNRITELADLVEDQPMTGLERAVWWTEYVIRHKGATHFRSPALDMPLYQYYFWDVIAVLVFIITVLLCIIVVVSKICLRFLNKAFFRVKVKKG
ncbi:hypothetical protein PPYR_14689 [Photinus pyralis]|uniref:UDP-glucuronosyltransferase n=1 Tax=Photinus pyralis TaxID=7054 RepID=A0A5N4A5Y0_PHOPY|nr:UDP-glucuronosyltransferase 2C1-like [Photinus pyralis]XP_031357293.1 UDP-glucuronosyltransferase 2C1-like [Photinus pyralis]KAB0792728.1 hypothetical protein PPYR_14687 [Photinus pyralis]KAB0792730.1 hypothetical protein PPYR_14689 [Photinus pyralis]